MGDSDEEEMKAMRDSKRYGGRKPAGPEPPAAKGKQPDVNNEEDKLAAARRSQASKHGYQQPTGAKLTLDTKPAAAPAQAEDEDEPMAEDEEPEGMRGFLPISFGKKGKKIEKKSIPEIHNGNKRADAKKGDVQFGSRIMDAAMGTGATVRAARAEAERNIRERKNGGPVTDGATEKTGDSADVEQLRVAMDSRGMRLEDPEDDEPDVLPLPGKEKEVIPVTHEVSIPAHDKVVTAMAFDLKASRMITGSVDGSVKFYDFNGMSEAKGAFREIEPIEAHRVQALDFTCSGSIILVICSDSHARLYDRDGSPAPIQTTVKGDTYVRMPEHTQGHTQMMTDGQCHPFQPEHWLTSSLDGTLRIWDINAKPVGMDQQLPCTHVLKIVNSRNVCVGGASGRGGGLHPTCCVYAPGDGKTMVAGCSDGSVQVFNEKARYQKADRILRTAHKAAVTSVAFVHEGSKNDFLVTRALDNTMKVWDCRMLSDAKGPVKTYEDLPAEHEKTGVCCSPDGKYIVTGTAFTKGALGNAVVKVYDAKTFETAKTLSFGQKSVTRMAWPRDINQLVVGSTTGEVVMMYSPFSSEKGALHFVGKRAKTRSLDDSGQGVNAASAPIFNMTDPTDIQRFYTTGHGDMAKIRRHEARMSQKTKGPVKQKNALETDSVGNFAAAVLKSGGLQHGRKNVEQDSQKALLAMEERVSKDSLRDSVFNRAYAGNIAPLDFTPDEAVGDERMREKMAGDFCRKCGQKVCRCVDYSTWGANDPKGTRNAGTKAGINSDSFGPDAKKAKYDTVASGSVSNSKT